MGSIGITQGQEAQRKRNDDWRVAQVDEEGEVHVESRQVSTDGEQS